MKIIVDAFGGDNAPLEIVAGAVDALSRDAGLSIILTGDAAKLKDVLSGFEYDGSRLSVIHAPSVINNDEAPTAAIKQKKDSSLVKALEILSSDETVQGMVSAGSTGAVLAGAFMLVGRIKGVSRPALAPVLPTINGNGVVLCDCGANVDCKAVNLLHFAHMGAAFARAMTGAESPRIGLLSNGAEDKKGNELNQEAFALLKEDTRLNFKGNCEARDILSGEYDVVVADGFNGNIALKSAEGTANAIFAIMMDEMKKGGIKAKLGALLFKPVLKSVKRKMDYNSQGGACFLGVNKVVIKAHGSSARKSITASILQAAALAKANVPETIKDALGVKENI